MAIVHVGNSCPTILKKMKFYFLEEKRKKEKVTGYNDNGMVYTDLWNVTIMNKQKLIEIV